MFSLDGKTPGMTPLFWTASFVKAWLWALLAGLVARANLRRPAGLRGQCRFLVPKLQQVRPVSLSGFCKIKDFHYFIFHIFDFVGLLSRLAQLRRPDTSNTASIHRHTKKNHGWNGPARSNQAPKNPATAPRWSFPTLEGTILFFKLKCAFGFFLVYI